LEYLCVFPVVKPVFQYVYFLYKTSFKAFGWDYKSSLYGNISEIFYKKFTYYTYKK